MTIGKSIHLVVIPSEMVLPEVFTEDQIRQELLLGSILMVVSDSFFVLLGEIENFPLCLLDDIFPFLFFLILINKYSNSLWSSELLMATFSILMKLFISS